MSDWENKVWGRTRPIIQTDIFSRHELEMLKGGYCSFHYHQRRSNRFTVVSGRVRIVYTIGWQIFSQVVTPIDTFCDIPAKVAHQFQVLEAGVMIEDYHGRHGNVEANDIQRFTTGGLLPVDINALQTGIILDQYGLLCNLRQKPQFIS